MKRKEKEEANRNRRLVDWNERKMSRSHRLSVPRDDQQACAEPYTYTHRENQLEVNPHQNAQAQKNTKIAPVAENHTDDRLQE